MITTDEFRPTPLQTKPKKGSKKGSLIRKKVRPQADPNESTNTCSELDDQKIDERSISFTKSQKGSALQKADPQTTSFPPKLDFPPTFPKLGVQAQSARARSTSVHRKRELYKTLPLLDSTGKIEDTQLMRQAMHNLGMKPDDLRYPTDEEVQSVDKDPSMFDFVKNEISLLINNRRNLVFNELKRLQNKLNTPHRSSSERKALTTVEKKLLEKIETNNRREAMRMIQTILMEQLLNVEAKLDQQLIMVTARQKEKELKKKMKEEKSKFLERKRTIKEREKRIKREQMARIQEAKEAEERYKAKRKELERVVLEKYKRIEEERKRKNQRAKEIALQKEIERKALYVEQSKAIEERERKFKEKRDQEKKLKEIENQKIEEKKKEKVEQVQKLQQEILEQKKRKAERRDLASQEILKKKNENILLNMKTWEEKNAIRQKKTQSFCLERDKFQEEYFRKKVIEKEKRNWIAFQEKRKSLEFDKKKKHIHTILKEKEAFQKCQSLSKRSEAITLERLEEQEERMRLIAIKKLEAQKKQEERERLLRSLSVQKEKAVQSRNSMTLQLQNSSNETELKKIADKYQIDYDLIKKQISSSRRAKRIEEKAAKLDEMEMREKESL